MPDPGGDARGLGVDPGTLVRWERGKGRSGDDFKKHDRRIPGLLAGMITFKKLKGLSPESQKTDRRARADAPPCGEAAG